MSKTRHSNNRIKFNKILIQNYMLLGILIIVILVFSLINPRFFTLSNFINVMRQISMNLIIACGMTLVLISAGIDLSVGSTVALAGCVCCWALLKWGIFWGIFAAICVGILVGFFNGMIVSKLKVPPFIVTLGSMNIIRGIVLLFTKGEIISNLPPEFLRIGTGRILFIPIPIIIAVIIAIITHLVLENTEFGLNIKATGGNYEVARLAGINVRRILILVYIIIGVLSSITGVVLSARVASGQPLGGIGYELQAIGATVIGGTSLFGGEGRIAGTFIGAILIGTLTNGLNLAGVHYFWQQIAIGLIIIIAVVIDINFRKKTL